MSRAADAGNSRRARVSAGGYFERSQLPLPSLLFLLPLIVLYEIGTLCFAVDSHHHTETRLLAFNYLQRLFRFCHAGGARFLPALAVVGILLAWHIARNDAWDLNLKTPALMALEALVLTLPLLALNCLTVRYVPLAASAASVPSAASATPGAPASFAPDADSGSPPYLRVASSRDPWRDGGPARPAGRPLVPIDRLPGERLPPERPLGPVLPPPAPPSAATRSAAGSRGRAIDLVLSIGAGIYEELVFRLAAFTLLSMVVIDLFKARKSWAVPAIVVVSAVLFSGYHYLGQGEAFQLRTFLFRTGAGIYFGHLFFARGFGITSGCHSAYDILVFLLRSFTLPS